MPIDIPTIVFVTILTHLLQVLAFLYHSRVNPHVPGPGWWLAWSAAECLGFSLVLLRRSPALLPIAILLQDPLLTGGTFLMFVGIRRFFGQSVNWTWLGGLYAAFLAAHLWFYLVVDAMAARTNVMHVAISLTAFLSAWSCFQRSSHPVRSTATFNGVAFAFHGGLFAISVILAVFFPGVPKDTVRTLDVARYFDALFGALVWSFGFILMVNHRLNDKLQIALDQVRTLRGIVPICASCKKIRDDKGFWLEVERYVSHHTEAQFSHGICPDCMGTLYPQFTRKTNGANDEGDDD